MTDNEPKQLFRAPTFKNANGDRLLITFPGKNANSRGSYLSSRQFKCNWQDALERDTDFVATIGQKQFDLTIAHTVQAATSRDQTQHRYAIRNFSPVFQSLKGQPGDLFGIARSSKGKYLVEKNTDEVKKMHEFFFPDKSKAKIAKVTTATTSNGAAPATKKQGRQPQKPSSATVTTTEDYFNDCSDRDASEGPTNPPKRCKIGGSSGPTKWISRENDAPPATATTATARQKFNQAQRLMGPLARPPHDPMLLLPGEVPLGIETFFGEGHYASLPDSNTTQPLPLPPPALALASSSSPAPDCPALPPARYRYAVNRAREGMKKKAHAKGGKSLVLRAVKAVELFERICLEDDTTPVTAAERKAACIEYDAVLREIYPELMLDAHVLDVKILENQEGTEELQLLRCMERRFIIWKQGSSTAKHPLQYNSPQLPQLPQPPPPPSVVVPRPGVLAASFQWISGRMFTSPIIPIIKSTPAAIAHINRSTPHASGSGPPVAIPLIRATPAGNQVNQRTAPGSSSGATIAAAPAMAGVDVNRSASLTKWGDGLKLIWNVFSSRVGDKQYGDVDLMTTEANVSCALNDTIWWNGQLVRRPVSADQPVLATIAAAVAGKRDGNPRLYLTDGSMPDYEAQNYPRAAPGMPCHVDALTNTMLPHAVRSSRSTNLFHFLKNESTGTGTFTLFCGVGPGTNLTAFHYETKRRRSYNCATGDYIFQPLAASANTRAMMRVHAAIAGRHSRHGQLLPLECYLEEGIKMVTHLRTEIEPSLCELCEQSMHAFITFDDGTLGIKTPSPPPTLPSLHPTTTRNSILTKNGVANTSNGISNTSTSERMMPLKVSCNDFDLIWDIDATYYTERVSKAYHAAGILVEEAPPSDGADTWIQSSYLTAEPRTVNNGAAGFGTGGSAISKALGLSFPVAGKTDKGIRPWACEVKSAARKEINSPGWKSDLRGQKTEIGDWDLDSDMDVIVVRTAEKLLDVLFLKVTPDVVQPWVGEVPPILEANDALRRLIPVINDMRTRALSEKEKESQTFFNGPEEGRDGTICHFSREYLEDLLEKILYARMQSQAMSTGPLESNLGINLTCNETVSSVCGAHVPPNIFHSERAEDLMELPPGVLRKLWMYRLVQEREAVLEKPLSLETVAVARRKRHAAELAFDAACCELIERNACAWGIAQMDTRV